MNKPHEGEGVPGPKRQKGYKRRARPRQGGVSSCPLRPAPRSVGPGVQVWPTLLGGLWLAAIVADNERGSSNGTLVSNRFSSCTRERWVGLNEKIPTHGSEAVENILENTKIKLKRKILGD